MPETIFVNSPEDAAKAMQGVVNETLERMKTVTHRAAFMDLVVPKLQRYHREYFEREAGPSGRPWAKLHPMTVKKKGHATILIEKGWLLMSLVEQNGFSIRKFRREGSKVVFEYGTNRPEAWRHMTGTGRINQNLPKREFLGLDETRVSAIVSLLADNVVKQLKAAPASSRMAG